MLGKAVHDYQFFKDENIGDFIPENIPCWLDNGFLGIKKDYPNLNVKMPKKKPKGKELSKKDKNENKQISSIRILSEHTIGGVKRYKIVSDIYRNIKEKFEDKIMLVACGLWNYHLKTG